MIAKRLNELPNCDQFPVYCLAIKTGYVVIDISYIQKLPVWAYNKPPFLKLIKKSLCECMFLQIRYQPNITNSGGMIWEVRIAIFTEIRHIWYKNWSPFCLFLDLKICAIWQLD